MSRQTDNANLPAKLALRRRLLDELALERYEVLDLYHGAGHVWSALADEYAVRVTGVDTKPRTAGTLRMSAEDAVRRLDVSRYDVFDLDAYGHPFGALRPLLDKLASLPRRTVCVCWTWGYLGPFTQVPHELMMACGWPIDIPQTIPGTMFGHDIRAAIARAYPAGRCKPALMLQYADPKRCYTGMVADVGKCAE